jgi:hypothetical protein
MPRYFHIMQKTLIRRQDFANIRRRIKRAMKTKATRFVLAQVKAQAFLS